MKLVDSVGEIFAAIQEAKNGATEFTTNFFPVEKRLQEWVARRELMLAVQGGVAFVCRKERGFQHLYYSAASTDQLFVALGETRFNDSGAVLDIVAKDGGLESFLTRWEAAGFHRHTKLFRMARIATAADPDSNESGVTFAKPDETTQILELLESNFDVFGEQVPLLYELEAAVSQQQVLVARHANELAGLLFFETQGVSSTLRFWTVGEKFRSLRLGSALMRRYFSTQNKVKRFVLWVAADNTNAVQKYEHYGYKPDGLVDYVLANRLICS